MRAAGDAPKVVSVDALRPDPEAIEQARLVLAGGGLVAFPTETVYGLGARGLHSADVERIFVAKGRPTGHPLILHVDGEAMASDLCAFWNERASLLARKFWPGPLTLVVPRAACVPDAVTGGLDSVGLRAPKHPVALALIRALGEPLAAPSANAHMHVSPTTAAHVVRSLGTNVALVLDAGACAHGIESTVVDLVGPEPRVLRAGATSLEALRSVLPDLVYEPLAESDATAVRRSPGLALRHYAPRTRVVLAARGPNLAEALRDLPTEGRFGAIVWSAEAHAGLQHAGPTLSFLTVLPSDAVAYAHDLFAALHNADAAGLDALIIESVPDAPAWWAVRDRLRRAAHAED